LRADRKEQRLAYEYVTDRRKQRTSRAHTTDREGPLMQKQELAKVWKVRTQTRMVEEKRRGGTQGVRSHTGRRVRQGREDTT